MPVCPEPSPLIPSAPRECARDSVADVDPMRIDVHIDNHSDVPLDEWKEKLRHKRRKRDPKPAPPAAPEAPGRPDALIDDYAAPAAMPPNSPLQDPPACSTT